MAPAQILNAHLSPKVDLFAWGSTMVLAATGRKAFPATTPRLCGGISCAIRRGCNDLDDSLRRVVELCLRKGPDKRPTSAQARRMFLGFRPASVRKQGCGLPAVRRSTWGATRAGRPRSPELGRWLSSPASRPRALGRRRASAEACARRSNSTGTGRKCPACRRRSTLPRPDPRSR
jgi:serine/threonine protein kinase